MKTIKTIGNFSCVILAFISVFVCAMYGYYHFFVKDTTTGINYISDQLGLDIVKAEDLSDTEKNSYEERWFMEASYYSNKANNGIALQELNFNYFMDYTLTSDVYRSTGMQYLGNYKYKSTEYYNSVSEVNRAIDSNFFYYDTVNGISYSGYSGKNPELSIATLLNRNAELIIKIDNKPYSIQLTGKYDVYDSFLWWKWVAVTYYYGYSNVFENVMNTIKSNNAGYGSYYVTIDLSTYFTIKEYDTKSGKFKTDDVTDIIKNYTVLKFHYYENGAKNSKQSLFGIINNNPNYGLSDEIDTSYWKAKVVYNLTEKDIENNFFSMRYSQVYQGYLLSLGAEAKNLFASMGDTKVIIKLDLNSQYLSDKGYNLVGVDYSGFENFDLDSIYILGNNQSFYFLENSLINTNLKTIYHSTELNIIISENATNADYAEVIV